MMLQKLTDYNPSKGAEFSTYIYPFIRDAILRFRMGDEKWSVSSLTSYKMLRSMAYLYHNTKDVVIEFSQKHNCDIALAEEYLKVVRGIRNQQPFYVTDEYGDWATIKSNKYAKTAISYLLHCKNEDLAKDIVIPFES